MKGKAMIPLVLAALLVAVAAFILYRHVTTPFRIMELAERDELVATNRDVGSHWRKLREMAIERIATLDPGGRAARLGMVELLCGTLYWQFVEETGGTVISHLGFSLREPDNALVDALVDAYVPVVKENPFGEAADPSGLIVTKIKYYLDFRSLESFLRKSWERLQPVDRGRLARVFDKLLWMAHGERDGEVDEHSSWFGIDPGEKERIQSLMTEELAEWVLPTMHAAARGEGVAAEDAGHFLYLLRAHRLEE